MYRCVGCEGVAELGGQCLCGKTEVDHKGRVSGENFVKVDVAHFTGGSGVRTCPHCGWRGFVSERISLGCPSHGIWYKSPDDLNIWETDCDTDQRPQRRNDRYHLRSG